MKKLFIILLFCAITEIVLSQKPEATADLALIELELVSFKGFKHTGQTVTFTSKTDSKTYSAKSDVAGIASLLVPKNDVYVITITNYPRKQEIPVPDRSYYSMMTTLTYEKTAVDFEKKYAMTKTEKDAVIAETSKLKDTTYYSGSKNHLQKPDETFMVMTIELFDLHDKPLTDENVYIKGRNSSKVFTGKTGQQGKIVMRLPKGDTYDVNFFHDRNYEMIEVLFTSGFHTADIQIAYLGTKEVERRKKEEEIRIKEEEARIKREWEAFEKYAKEHAKSLADAYKSEVESYTSKKKNMTDNVVEQVLSRNKKWVNKIIVCDLTGSMSPYAAQLLTWYKLNFSLDKSMQFVFFNDGDNKPDNAKKTGETGGIYYFPNKNYEELVKSMSMVAAAGYGGDCPENNMEALIKGTALAQDYGNIIMIADNYAPVKDIELLDKFTKPVHIIVCGSNGGIHPDYLRIAWKTKGSVHTMEEDITAIAKLLDGQTITIGGKIYKLLKGKFIEMERS